MFKSNKHLKLRSFCDTEENCFNSGGSSYIKVTTSVEQAEQFINEPGIEVLELHYSTAGKNQSILVVYTEAE